MNKTLSVTIALILSFIILALIVIAWWFFTGWTKFSYKIGDLPVWAAQDITKLRFRNCIFTVTMNNGTAQHKDVSSNLDAMAAAYVGAKSIPPSIGLYTPLNPYSFIIDGFNDSKTVKNPYSQPYCAGPVSACTSNAQCPPGLGGCYQGKCVNCPGGMNATLTGEYRLL